MNMIANTKLMNSLSKIIDDSLDLTKRDLRGWIEGARALRDPHPEEFSAQLDQFEAAIAKPGKVKKREARTYLQPMRKALGLPEQAVSPKGNLVADTRCEKSVGRNHPEFGAYLTVLCAFQSIEDANRVAAALYEEGAIDALTSGELMMELQRRGSTEGELSTESRECIIATAEFAADAELIVELAKAGDDDAQSELFKQWGASGDSIDGRHEGVLTDLAIQLSQTMKYIDGADLHSAASDLLEGHLRLEDESDKIRDMLQEALGPPDSFAGSMLARTARRPSFGSLTVILRADVVNAPSA